MRQLVLLVVTLVYRNEDTEIEVAGYYSDRYACKLCAELVEATCGDASSWALDVISRDGWVVRSLLCEVGDPDWV
jgi:hypothetical protein